jgi:hypothetical protein
MKYTIPELCQSKGTSEPVQQALICMSAEINRLRLALNVIIVDCGDFSDRMDDPAGFVESLAKYAQSVLTKGN